MKNLSRIPDHPGFNSGPASTEHADRFAMGSEKKSNQENYDENERKSPKTEA